MTDGDDGFRARPTWTNEMDAERVAAVLQRPQPELEGNGPGVEKGIGLKWRFSFYFYF